MLKPEEKPNFSEVDQTRLCSPHKPEVTQETGDSVGTKLNISFSLNQEMTHPNSKIISEKLQDSFESDNKGIQTDKPLSFESSSETLKINTADEAEAKKETAAERRRRIRMQMINAYTGNTEAPKPEKPEDHKPEIQHNENSEKRVRRKSQVRV